jgi:hypothetical protein
MTVMTLWLPDVDGFGDVGGHQEWVRVVLGVQGEGWWRVAA